MGDDTNMTLTQPPLEVNIYSCVAGVVFTGHNPTLCTTALASILCQSEQVAIVCLVFINISWRFTQLKFANLVEYEN